MRELHGQRKDYPGLADALAKAYGGRIERAFQGGAFAEGRRVLHDLEGLAGDHPIVSGLRAMFTSRAEELVSQAETAEPSQRQDRLAEALRIWPTLPGAADRYREAFRRFADARRGGRQRLVADRPLAA